MSEEGGSQANNLVTMCDRLPNLREARLFAFDIGSSLVKIAYTSRIGRTKTTRDRRIEQCNSSILRAHFSQFKIEHFRECLIFFSKECIHLDKSSVVCTGSCASSFQSVIEEVLGIGFSKVDEMECLVKGNNFLLSNIVDEAFTYDHHNAICKYRFETVDICEQFPYLLINIGTGTSVYKVENGEKFERVGGSSLGGGCFFGMGSVLGCVNDFDELVRMAEEGDHRNVDLLVSDIYGGREHKLALPDDVIACSFGKCADVLHGERVKKETISRADISRSLLLMISNSIGQIAVLYASNLKAKKIYFGGYFIRNHAIVMRTISYAVNFWSQGAMQAQFLRHECYTAVIGAILKAAELFNRNHPSIADNSFSHSWKEHYSDNTAVGRFIPTAPLCASFNVGNLEVESCEMKLSMFPLLKSSRQYHPDTVSLNEDSEAREYWIDILARSVQKTTMKATASQEYCDDVGQRAQLVVNKYLQHLTILKEKPCAYGCCTVRNLLDLKEQILHEHLFDDAYLNQKRVDNDMGLKELKTVLDEVDAIGDPRDTQIRVVKGLLAGNVFDWGASEVVKLMEGSNGLSFSRAISTLQKRPWLVDGLDEWLLAFFKKSYKCAVIFADNSGADILLGVLPFARELLRVSTKVIIACNFSPALNDITAGEMENLMESVAPVDETLGTAWREGSLMVCNNGQGSPCLDLRRVNSKLCEMVHSESVDLVVIEGMGRAIHTNYDAQFTCDSLKAAVIKTKWVAERLGGDLFSIVCEFARGS